MLLMNSYKCMITPRIVCLVQRTYLHIALINDVLAELCAHACAHGRVVRVCEHARAYEGVCLCVCVRAQARARMPVRKRVLLNSTNQRVKTDKQLEFHFHSHKHVH